MNDDWSDEETDNPLLADDRNFYKLEKWTKDGMHVASMLYTVTSAILSTKETILRRVLASLMSVNALHKAMPSGEEINPSMIAVPLEPEVLTAFGDDAPSKKKSGVTCKTLAICCSRLAPMRFLPFSYLCTC